jgi:hypothetical protein
MFDRVASRTSVAIPAIDLPLPIIEADFRIKLHKKTPLRPKEALGVCPLPFVSS